MLRKIAEIKVPTGAGPREVKTKHVFASYDRQGAAFAFYFSENNIAGTKANLLFMIDGQKVFVDDDVTLSETNETHTFTYPLPDKLLNYTGKVDGYLYFDFEDGSHSDEIHFIFTIKKSQIDEEMEDAPDVYIKSFEEVKKDVQNKATQAKKDMQANADAVKSDYESWKKATETEVSNINQKVGEAENKASDLEKHLDVGQKNYFSTKAWENKEDWTITNGKIQAIKIALVGNTKYTLSTNIPKAGNNDDVFFTTGDKNTVNTPSDGASINNPRSITTKEDGVVIVAIRDKDMSNNEWWIMLNKGEEAYRWVPHTDDIVTKSHLGMAVEHGPLTLATNFENYYGTSKDPSDQSTFLQYARVGNICLISGIVKNTKILKSGESAVIARMPDHLKVIVPGKSVCQGSSNNTFLGEASNAHQSSNSDRIMISRIRNNSGESSDFAEGRWLNINVTCVVEVSR